ncbi:MAG: hypothetical protein ACLUD0_10685 [Eubacterium ramulus]
MQGNGAPAKTESLMWGMATGACPGQAQNRPLSREELEKALTQDRRYTICGDRHRY